MAKISIIVGTRKKGVEVEAWPFLPGLYAHQDFGGERSALYTITHIDSGLKILGSINEGSLELCRSVLGKLLWDRSAESIFEDGRYYRAIKEAESVLTNHERSEKQEKKIAEDLGGKRQPASGSRWGYRRDVKTPAVLVEAKTTTSKAFSVLFKDLEFIRRQAYNTGRIPAYMVSVGGSSEVVILPDQDVGEDDISTKSEQKMLSYNGRSKSMTINQDVVKHCSGGGHYNVLHGKTKYTIMGYEAFLIIAKRGV